jgi:hypothetical protein
MILEIRLPALHSYAIGVTKEGGYFINAECGLRPAVAKAMAGKNAE